MTKPTVTARPTDYVTAAPIDEPRRYRDCAEIAREDTWPGRGGKRRYSSSSFAVVTGRSSVGVQVGGWTPACRPVRERSGVGAKSGGSQWQHPTLGGRAIEGARRVEVGRGRGRSRLSRLYVAPLSRSQLSACGRRRSFEMTHHASRAAYTAFAFNNRSALMDAILFGPAMVQT